MVPHKKYTPKEKLFYERFICPYTAIMLSILVYSDLNDDVKTSNKMIFVYICTTLLFLANAFITRGELRGKKKDIFYYLNFGSSILLGIFTAALVIENYLL